VVLAGHGSTNAKTRVGKDGRESGIRTLKEHFMDLQFLVRALRVAAVVLAAVAQILLHVMT
jgi:hypothetical protein